MAIQGLEQYGGFYNTYRTNAIPSVSVDTVKQQEEQRLEAEKTQSLQSSTYTYTGQEEDNRSRIANLEDVSLTFNREDTFDYIGSDSEITSLDVQKAVSDMKKDQVLEEYQYFVGSSLSMNNMQSEDGIVLQKMNF